MDSRAIVVGAGIAGLAMARALALRGYAVTVIERNHKAVGASIRNFGMVWPIGQPQGVLYNRAMRSRTIWKEICDEAGIWYDPVGSMHIAYRQDEWDCLQEFATLVPARGYQLLAPADTLAKSPVINPNGLLGALFSPHELIVDPRQAIAQIPIWLTEKYNVEFIWGQSVTAIEPPFVYAGKQKWEASRIVVCSGADFESIYPEEYGKAPLTRCKLQMMRMGAQPLRIGPSLCGALSLIHYSGFAAAPSVQKLKRRFEEEYPDYLRYGIHVMVSQNGTGELTVGDSHAYGHTHEPFDHAGINELILTYLQRFARFPNEKIIESWNGIYPKLTNGDSHLFLKPEKNVWILNGLGGAGMTLSFGLAEEVCIREEMD